VTLTPRRLNVTTDAPATDFAPPLEQDVASDFLSGVVDNRNGRPTMSAPDITQEHLPLWFRNGKPEKLGFRSETAGAHAALLPRSTSKIATRTSGALRAGFLLSSLKAHGSERDLRVVGKHYPRTFSGFWGAPPGAKTPIGLRHHKTIARPLIVGLSLTPPLQC
jgi:hypothetical protein